MAAYSFKVHFKDCKQCAPAKILANFDENKPEK